MKSRLRAARQVLAGVPGDVPLPEVARAAKGMIVAATVASNVLGAAIVTVLLLVVLPLPEGAEGDPGSLALSGLYVAAAAVYSCPGSRRRG